MTNRTESPSNEGERILIDEYRIYSKEIRDLADAAIKLQIEWGEEQNESGDPRESEQYVQLIAQLNNLLESAKQVRLKELEVQSANWSEKRRLDARIDIEASHEPAIVLLRAMQNRMRPAEVVRLTKRDLLIGAGAAAVTGAAFLAAPSIWVTGQDMFNQEANEKEANFLRKFIENRYGIRCATKRTGARDQHMSRGGVRLEEMTSKYIELQALRTIRQMLAQYPPAFIKQTVKEIIIVEDLIIFGKSETAAHFQGWIAIKHEGAMETVSRAAISERALHHEIAHGATSSRPRFLRLWSEIQDPSSYLGDRFVKAPHHPKGFAREYGTKNLYEDIATVGEGLMVENRQLYRRTLEDTILMQKASLMMRLYEQLSSAEPNKKKMDRTYWDKRLRAEPIDEAYWD